MRKRTGIACRTLGGRKLSDPLRCKDGKDAKWRANDFKHELYQQVPVVLVGNKVDLEDEREVSPSEGQALAEDWGCPFMETSAKSKTMVDELFAEIVRQMDFCPLPDRREACCPACSVQ
nr:PREDICTED: ras-related protein Rap-2a-like [Paralichthys olivaceus]